MTLNHVKLSLTFFSLIWASYQVQATGESSSDGSLKIDDTSAQVGGANSSSLNPQAQRYTIGNNMPNEEANSTNGFVQCDDLVDASGYVYWTHYVSDKGVVCERWTGTCASYYTGEQYIGIVAEGLCDSNTLNASTPIMTLGTGQALVVEAYSESSNTNNTNNTNNDNESGGEGNDNK